MIWMWSWLAMKPHAHCHLGQLLPYTSHPGPHFTCVLINRGKCKWIHIVKFLMPEITVHRRLMWNVCLALGIWMEKLLIARIKKQVQGVLGCRLAASTIGGTKVHFFKHALCTKTEQRLFSNPNSRPIKLSQGFWLQLLLFCWGPFLPSCVKKEAD